MTELDDACYCENCSCCVITEAMPVHLGYEDWPAESAECEEVLVYRGDDPVVTETWCAACIRAIRDHRGEYTMGDRVKFGHAYRSGTQSVRIELLREEA